MHLDEGELRGSCRWQRRGKACLLGANLRDIDVEVADRVGLKLPAPGPLALYVGNPEMPSRCRQRCSEERVSSGIDAWSAVEAIVEREQGIPGEK